jgi:hypothetical protein
MSRRVTLASTISLLALAAGCGGHAAAPAPSKPVSVAEWRAVVTDWLSDRKMSRRHSCAAVVVARSELTMTDVTYSPIFAVLNRYERSVCPQPTNVWGVVAGMTDRQVVAIAGAPVPGLSGPRCWVYKHNKPGTSVDGARYCFTDGRVTLVQTAVHG